MKTSEKDKDGNRKRIRPLARQVSASSPSVAPAASGVRLKKLLVPIDFSEPSLKALKYAVAFAGRVLGTISAAMIVVAALLGLLMPFVITVLAPGFAGHEALQFAVNDARLMLPYLAFAGPVTVMLALASAESRFALTAFSPVLFNVALIAMMIVLIAMRPDAGMAALILAATVGVAGLLQLSILVLRRRGDVAATPLRVSVDPEMRAFLGRALPGMIASAAPQLLIVAGAVIASASPSAVSWLYFANRLIELPLGMVGVAMGTVLIPELTRALRGNDKRAIGHAESRALELATGLALPATLGLIVLSEPIVRLLFEHGAFTAADTAATAQAMVFLALGLPAQVLVKALSPAFFAREDTLAPLWATLKAIVVAIVCSVLLGHFFGAAGIAAGIALGAWSNALSLIRQGAASFGFSVDRAARRRLPRIAAAALMMGGLLWLSITFIAHPMHGPAQAAILLLLIIGGIAVYALFLGLLAVTSWREAVNAIRQGKPRDLRA